MSSWSKETMAKNLQHYMDLLDVSRMDIARLCGVSKATVGHWLNALRYPRIDKIEIMAKYFGIQKSDLIEDNTKTTEEDIALKAQRAAKIAKDKDLAEMIQMYQALPEDKKKTIKQMVLDYYKAFA